MMKAKLFTYPYMIKERDLDTFGHVNNATYFTLFEEARWDLITQNGYGLQKIRETGLGPTVLEVKATFHKELKLRDKIVIETQVDSYDKKIGRLTQKILRDGENCCTAEFVFGLFDVKQRKLIVPTEEWLRGVGIE